MAKEGTGRMGNNKGQRKANGAGGERGGEGGGAAGERTVIREVGRRQRVVGRRQRGGMVRIGHVHGDGKGQAPPRRRVPGLRRRDADDLAGCFVPARVHPHFAEATRVAAAAAQPAPCHPDARVAAERPPPREQRRYLRRRLVRVAKAYGRVVLAVERDFERDGRCHFCGAEERSRIKLHVVNPVGVAWHRTRHGSHQNAPVRRRCPARQRDLRLQCKYRSSPKKSKYSSSMRRACGVVC